LGLSSRLTQQNDRLLVVLEGEFTVASTAAIVKEIFDVCYGRKLSKVFIDATRIISSPSIMERFQIAENYAEVQKEYASKYGYAIKLVIYGIEPVIAPDRFGEIVGHNRGALMLKVTTNLTEAEDWLKD
jgi:hypothetical protein